MDSFGANTNQRNLIIKDTLIKTDHSAVKTTAPSKSIHNKISDSVVLSRNDLDKIVSTISDSKIMDFQTIKDAATFSGTENFDIKKLSDNQLEELFSAVKRNITETIAETIYNTTHNEKLLELTAKEKTLFDNILIKLQQSKVTDISQAIEFIQSHTSENPGLLAKVSELLIPLTNKHNVSTPLNNLKEDIFSGNFNTDPNRFTNPFKSNIYTRNDQPKSVDEAKDLLSQIINNDINRLKQNEKAIADTSNLIAGQLLSNKQSKILENNINILKSEDQVWVNNNMLLKNTTFINDVAAKVATKKAKTVITCRLLGEVGGAVTGALGMASIAGASPLIGIVGAFALTILATVVGFVLGKISGEAVGKLLSGTSVENYDNNPYENIETPVDKVSSEQQGKQNNKDKNEKENKQDDEDSNKDEVSTEEPVTPSFSDFMMDKKASEVLKTSVLYKK